MTERTLDLTKLPHMDVVDMPSDPNGYLGNFRATLRGTYNHNRSNRDAIHSIRDTLEYAVSVLQAAEVAPVEQTRLSSPEVPSAPEKQTSSSERKTKPSTRAAKR